MATSTRVEWNDGAMARVKPAAAHGLNQWADLVLQRSEGEVPKLSGELEHSGHADVDEGSLEGAVSYDGPYAEKQHEDLAYHHTHGGKAKFLEQPLNATRSEGLDLLAAAVRRALGG